MTWAEIILPEPGDHATEVNHVTLGSFEICWVCLSSPARAGGEDSAFLGADGTDGLFGFAIDGMGGMARGAEAARVSATTLARELARPAELESPVQRAVRAVRQAHAQVIQHCAGGGATPIPNGTSFPTALASRRCRFTSARTSTWGSGTLR